MWSAPATLLLRVRVEEPPAKLSRTVLVVDLHLVSGCFRVLASPTGVLGN